MSKSDAPRVVMASPTSPKRMASKLMGKYKNHKYLWPGSSGVFSRIFFLMVDKDMENSWWIDEIRAPQEE